MQQAWHSFSIEKAFQELKTSSKGLTKKQVKKRLDKYGLNKLPEEKSFSKIGLFLEQFKSPLIYILIIAGIITLLIAFITISIKSSKAALTNPVDSLRYD